MAATKLPTAKIESLIFIMRGQRVMLSTDLAPLYGVEPKALAQAVKRNRSRFPPDFMFHLHRKELAILKSQFVTSSWGGARRAPPLAFTEQGVAMLSSALRSERAIQINVAIMRAFVKLREALSAHRDLAAKLAELERTLAGHDTDIQNLFDAIHQLMTPPAPPTKEIGFHVKEGRVGYGSRRQRQGAK
jgi:hypothetical protein